MSGALDHVEIYVSDLARSGAFWGFLLEALGWEPFQTWDSGRSWRLGATYLVFVQAERRFLDVPFHRCRAGLNHLALQARSRAEVDELAAALERRGATLLYRDRHPHAGGAGHYAAFLEDPDRIKVELFAP